MFILRFFRIDWAHSRTDLFLNMVLPQSHNSLVHANYLLLINKPIIWYRHISLFKYTRLRQLIRFFLQYLPYEHFYTIANHLSPNHWGIPQWKTCKPQLHSKFIVRITPTLCTTASGSLSSKKISTQIPSGALPNKLLNLDTVDSFFLSHVRTITLTHIEGWIERLLSDETLELLINILTPRRN